MDDDSYIVEELDRLIHDANERAHKGRLERLRLLFSVEDQESFPAPSLAWEFYQEARLCWYVGAFVATNVMSGIALEELLRTNYRVTRGVGGCLDNGKKIDEAGFAELIKQATVDKLLTSEESITFHRLRKDLRNPWVHPRDFDYENDFLKPNWLRQDIKIKAPNLLQDGIEEEAKEAIKLLVITFPRISRRFLGME
jgi:hypothetical protein